MTSYLHTMAGQQHIEDMARRADERRAFLPLQGSTEQTNEDDDGRRSSGGRFRRGARTLRPAV
jgi:hypothetical protein